MRVKLRVLKGTQAGREVVIPVSRFLIGRGEECHLRPRSDAISRQHCVIMVAGSHVTVRDLGSKNGSYVNGQRVNGEQVIHAGDEFHVGPLQFEVVIEQGVGGAKRPAAQDVREVASRTASLPTDELDIASWLEETDDTDVSRAVASPETRQFRLHDTNNLALDTDVAGGQATDGSEAADGDVDEAEAEAGEQGKEKTSDHDEKAKPGKLPPRPHALAKDSREAAADMLKRFFNR